jgi:YfiH family protein
MIEAASLKLTGIRHAFFTRDGGVSEGLYASLNGGIGSRDDAGNVAENRARMAAALGVEPHRFLTAYQIHSPNVVVAETAWSGETWTSETRPRADAIVTRMRALAIGVTTADCGPVLLADPQSGVIGAAHAGWRGALTGVIEATIEAMTRLGAIRENIRAAVGPMIRQPSYEVGPDLIARFAAEDRASSRFFAAAARDGHAQFDLGGYVAARLKRAGIGHVEDLGLCTYADPDRFFSYRRTTHRAEADYGRHVNAIALTAE